MEGRNSDNSVDSTVEGRRRSSSTSSRPSVFTESFHQHTFQQASAANPSSTANSSDAVVSADQERQVLLLMLLAQVCALHDPTPKTFTIHVVELFERGILDRESIHFLFELGLVPSLSPTRRMLQHPNHHHPTHTASTDIPNEEPTSPVSETTQAAYEEIANELALTTTTHTTVAKLSAVFAASQDPQRAAEAYAIRATLAQYESLQHCQTQDEKGGDTNKAHPPLKPWDVKHFPLSLSRYQREFVQIALLASGSFGQVFHATRNMDGCDYALKKVDFDAMGYSNETIQEVVREVECLAKVSDHPNVVRYYTSWLEPSWMTGGTKASPTAKAQPKLLTNMMQPAIQPVDDDFGTKDDSDSSSSSGSSFDPSSNRMWQRRFSFDSSVDTRDQSWETTHRSGIQGLERMAVDDSYFGSETNPSSPRRQRRPDIPSYKYQISLFIQMQLCHPATLADWIRERNTKVPEKNYAQRIGPALEIVEQIVRGLAHVHEKGIIHRDLKPANIFASKDGQVIKIGDFGLSKQLENLNRPPTTSHPSTPQTRETETSPSNDSSDSHQEHWNNAIVQKNNKFASQAIIPFQKKNTTATDHLTVGVGTRSYAAPEQLQTKSYSTAADIFSLGLIFLELVCCFETEHERLHNFQECRQQKIQPWVTEKYPEIASLILACTRMNPRERPSAHKILALLDRQAIGSSSGNKTVLDGPKEELHTALLRRSLERRNDELEQHKRELAEKDRMIESLRLEMERMRAEMMPNGREEEAEEEESSF